jgi:type III pantothenate kinase
VQRIKDSGYSDSSVVATGGLARMITAESKQIDRVVPELTLCGLKEIATLNGYKS